MEIIAESEYRFVIPRHGRMRVPGVVFASRALIPDPAADRALEQVINVAELPGIVVASYAMPDVHWGYGFPIGGVAATDIDRDGVVSPGGVGFDIACGVVYAVSPHAGDIEGIACVPSVAALPRRPTWRWWRCRRPRWQGWPVFGPVVVFGARRHRHRRARRPCGPPRAAHRRGPGAEPTGPLAAWLVSDERGELRTELRMLAAIHGVQPVAAATAIADLVIEPHPVVHTSHPAWGYLLRLPAASAVWAPEFWLFPPGPPERISCSPTRPAGTGRSASPMALGDTWRRWMSPSKLASTRSSGWCSRTSGARRSARSTPGTACRSANGASSAAPTGSRSQARRRTRGPAMPGIQ